jgi:hypothetical protein
VLRPFFRLLFPPSRPLDPVAVLHEQLSAQLLALGYRFASYPVAMGLYPDFLLSLDSEHYIIIEAKPAADALTLRRLEHSVTALEASSGILVLGDQLDATFTVVPSSSPSSPLVIVGPTGLAPALAFLTQQVLLPVASA